MPTSTGLAISGGRSSSRTRPATDGSACWDDEPVGFIDFEIDGERAGIAIYVRSEFRRRGIGEQLLRLVAAEGQALGVAELVGGVESDNVASIRCLIGAGFIPAGADEFGPVFRLRLPDA
jgi:RimJ/RimL family protein N-acetyltransferase